ncbi:TPA: hypothetical protein OZI11_002505 [Staphylococcus aureus]|nr:hypothetical protein [Staphylococcus aureus]
MANTTRKLNNNFFYNYKMSLIILTSAIIIGLFIHFKYHTLDFITPLLSISIPLLVLFIKLERDETNAKNERVLISRNFLLAYLIELDDINKRFNKLTTNTPVPNIDDLSQNINTYDDIVDNANDVNMLIESSLANIEVIEQREAIHSDLKTLLSDMLKRNDLVYTDDEYQIFREIQFAYIWMDNSDSKEIHEVIGDFKVSCGAYLNVNGIHFSDGETVVPPKWKKFKKSLKSLNHKIEMDKLISQSISKLIQTLEVYDPNALNINRKNKLSKK